MNYAEFIRDVPNFPKKGIIFKDITTLVKNGKVFSNLILELTERYKKYNLQKIVGIESRGFIFGASLASNLGIGFVPARKPGKLPAETISASYELEYGTDSIEIHRDAIVKGERVLIIDDLIATGGTAKASVELVEKLGGIVVEIFFLIELSFLKGREKLKNYPVYTIIKYDSE
ncbi:MAG: adenine phosphoribosyltransferase [Candidatus Hydrogenedentota bacterium]